MPAHLEDGLHVVDEEEAPPPGARTWSTVDLAIDLAEPEDDPVVDLDESGLEVLRDEFVQAFNARDLEQLTALVHPDVECPARMGDGAADLAEELEAIWERSPAAILTRAFLDTETGRTPCAVAWLPDEDGCWSRVTLVCFDTDGELITLVDVPDDVDALERAQAEDPAGEELEDWADWARWDRGEESPTGPRL